METQYADKIEQADNQQVQPAKHLEPQLRQSLGLIVFGNAGQEPNGLNAWGRTLSVFKEGNQNKYLVSDYHTPEHKKRHIKFIRKTSKYMAELFNSDANILCIENAGYRLAVPISDDVFKVVCAEVRNEVYMPLAFSRGKELLGGIYAYVWRCCTNAQAESTVTRSLIDHPVTSLVTGMCMFGSYIYGVDQYGDRHPLTNTFYSIPRGRKILSVALTEPGLHPYESMMLHQFRLQMPILKAMGGGMPQKVFYQSVFEEYVLYGINMFLRGEMSIAALKSYAHEVRKRVNLIKAHVAGICTEYGVEWDGGQSTLSALFGRVDTRADQDECVQATQEDPLDVFFSLVGIPSNLIVSDLPIGDRLAIIRKTFHLCINRLAAQTGALGEVWSHIENTLNDENDQNNSRYSDDTLLTINFLNYAAKVAFVRKTHAGEVCLSHPFHEKAMALSYRDMHAEKFGEILAINWIPPIFSHGAFKDGLYYLNEGGDLLNGLIEKGVLDHCAIQLGAHALGMPELEEGAEKKISSLLQEAACLPKEVVALQS